MKSALAKQTYSIDAKVKTGGAVKSTYLKFIGLPYELDISPHRDEILSVKIELDTDPPAGANVLTTTLRKKGSFRLHFGNPAQKESSTFITSSSALTALLKLEFFTRSLSSSTN